MIHPLFENVSDPYLAEALSELGQPGEFKTITSPRPGMTESENTSFPPEPAKIFFVTGVVIDERSDRVLRPALPMPHQGKQPNIRHLLNSYAKVVGEGQADAQVFDAAADVLELPESTDSRFGPTATWTIEKARADGKRLVAAHLAATTLRRNQVICAVVIPRVVVEEFPLLLRNAVEPLAFKRDEMEAKHPGISTALNDLMQGTSRAAISSIVAGASTLPTPATFNKVVRQGLKK